MIVEVPEVDRCCFYVPLRSGIIIFGYLNIVFSLIALISLIIITEYRKTSITNDESLEEIISTVLFAILGMGVILNILLLVAGIQKDILMLRLYSYYVIATTVAALVPTAILLTLWQIYEVGAACFAIGMQCYVIILVRSEVLKLEREQLDDIEASTLRSADPGVSIPDNESLL